MERQQFTAINQVMNPWYRTFTATIHYIQQRINQTEPEEGFAGLGSLFGDEPKRPPPPERWTISDWHRHIDMDIHSFILSLKYPVNVVYAYALDFDKHNRVNDNYNKSQLDKSLEFRNRDDQLQQLANFIFGYAIDDCDWPRDVFERDISTFDYFNKAEDGFEGLGSLFG